MNFGNTNTNSSEKAIPQEVCIVVALGANIGDRLTSLLQAREALLACGPVRMQAQSSLYETEPVGGPLEQGAYYNTVLQLTARLTPERLFLHMQQIEQAMGRPPRSKRTQDAPRIIDMDMLFYGEQVLRLPNLTVPHPRWHQRAFVLEPLAEILPNFVAPGQQHTVKELLQTLPAKDRQSVAKISCDAWDCFQPSKAT